MTPGARVCARKSVLWNHGKAPSYPLTAHRGRKGNAATPGRRDCHFERRSPWKSLGPHSPGGGAVPRERGRQSLSASLHTATFLFLAVPSSPPIPARTAALDQSDASDRYRAYEHGFSLLGQSLWQSCTPATFTFPSPDPHLPFRDFKATCAVLCSPTTRRSEARTACT